MAILADFTTYTYSDHATDTQEVTITNTDGTTEVVNLPVQVEATSTVTQKYVLITHYNFYKEVVDGSGNHLFDIQFKVYNSAAEKNANANSHISEGEILGQFHSITSSTDLRDKGYEILKADRRFSNITDA